MLGAGRHIFVRLLLGLSATFAAYTALADGDDGLKVLWWQVGDWLDDSETGESLADVSVKLISGGTTTAADLGVTHARIREVSSGSYLKIMDIDEDGNPIDFTLNAIDVPMRWVADISDFASGSPEYVFVIELGNYEGSSWSMLAVSETATYADLAANGNIITRSDYNPAYATPWMPMSYVVPEPTSGMLVFVGAALLALRRRRGALRRG